MIRSAQECGEWHRVESLLTALKKPFDASDVSTLLGLLVDDIERHSELFSIVHVAEQAEDLEYVCGLVAVMPTLIESAPWWARTLFVRVLNSIPAMEALITALPVSSSPQKRSTVSVMETVATWRPNQFDKQLGEVAKALSQRTLRTRDEASGP